MNYEFKNYVKSVSVIIIHFMTKCCGCFRFIVQFVLNALSTFLIILIPIT